MRNAFLVIDKKNYFIKKKSYFSTWNIYKKIKKITFTFLFLENFY